MLGNIGMKIFQVLKPGLFTTVQDVGRFGYLRYGIPISGAMDTFSLIAANSLLENRPGDACLETTIQGPELRALAHIQIAITGARISARINNKTLPLWQTADVFKGDTISLGRTESGCRAYIAARGGLDVPLVLGSRSTCMRAAIGGVEGRAVKSGDTVEGFHLPLLRSKYSVPVDLRPTFPRQLEVRVVMGPQADLFGEVGLERFFSSQYRVTPESDRMGYRLEGPEVKHRDGVDIVSDAVIPGSVQIPKDGKPIVMMRDAQTTGGYPKIAAVVTPDISLLGQAKPGDLLQFSEVTASQASEIYRKNHRLLNHLNQALIQIQ